MLPLLSLRQPSSTLPHLIPNPTMTGHAKAEEEVAADQVAADHEEEVAADQVAADHEEEVAADQVAADHEAADHEAEVAPDHDSRWCPSSP